MSTEKHSIIFAAILSLTNAALLAGLVVSITRIERLSRTVATLNTIITAKVSTPVMCETVRAAAPAAAPEKPKPPEHIAYQLLTTDRSMYGIYQSRCKTRKGFEGFEIDMTALNQHPESPQKIADKRSLARIKAGQTWWFPTYCKGLASETNGQTPAQLAQQ